MSKIGMIPARYGSSRFPGKPLADMNGKPMIQWVFEAVAKVPGIDQAYVATDDQRIYQAVTSFGGQAIMTSDRHTCGSERLAECADILNLKGEDIVINIQGDEPLIIPAMISDLINAFEDPEVYMATLKKRIEDESEIMNSNVVKVVTDLRDYAMLFSRFPIPFQRDGSSDVFRYKHIGIYGYKNKFLQYFTKLTKSPMETAESLEQLRVLENGFKIKVKETTYDSVGVDTPEQLEEASKRMRRG